MEKNIKLQHNDCRSKVYYGFYLFSINKPHLPLNAEVLLLNKTNKVNHLFGLNKK